MTELDDLVIKAEENRDNKIIPYLGWFWREFPDYMQEVDLALCEGKIWIDNAKKWSYPYCKSSIEDAIKIKELIKDIAIKNIELSNILESYKDKMNDDE